MRKQGQSKFQALILFMCLVSGIPLAIGVKPAPQTLEAALHPAIVQVWAIFLVLGSLLTLWATWIWRPITTGLILEEIGLAMAGLPSVIYAFVLIKAAGPDKASIAFAFIFGFSVACGWRYVDIWRYLHKLGELKQAQNEQG